MNGSCVTGPEFSAQPITLGGGTVLPGWLDYNGHMNVAYYVLAFDQAVDRMLEVLGIGPDYVQTAGQGPYALQTSIHYLNEMLLDEAFSFDALLIDCDHKRMHIMLRMFKADSVVATYEQILMNVDHHTRRSVAYPNWVQERLDKLKAAQANLQRPVQFGQPLGLRRRS
ncbi:MAG: thioesterase family protein [Pseudomonadota bacterium]